MKKQITSPQNPFIKNIALLAHKARERRPQGLFVAEGLREVGLALKNGFEAEALLYDETLIPAATVEALAATARISPKEIIGVSRPVFEKIAYRSTVANVVGLFKIKQPALADITFKAAPFILVVEKVEKPGNLGAMLRTAGAAGVDAVLVCDPLCDVFNPNTIRASLGAVFSLPVVPCTSAGAIDWLRQNEIRILATHLEAATSLYRCDLGGPVALVVGAESTGISAEWATAASERIIIPMAGQVDSMNVSVSAAIVLFEAVRQRSESETMHSSRRGLTLCEGDKRRETKP
jgi:RNA methyltransferase, TrmH family